MEGRDNSVIASSFFIRTRNRKRKSISYSSELSSANRL